MEDPRPSSRWSTLGSILVCGVLLALVSLCAREGRYVMRQTGRRQHQTKWCSHWHTYFVEIAHYRDRGGREWDVLGQVYKSTEPGEVRDWMIGVVNRIYKARHLTPEMMEQNTERICLAPELGA